MARTPAAREQPTDRRGVVSDNGRGRPTGEYEFKPAPELQSRATKSELVVIANRLPVHRVETDDGEQRWETSPGGLVTAVTPILRERGGGWIGWPGRAGSAPDPFVHDGINLRPIRISQSELDAFYLGFANRTLWPLYHDAIRTPEFRRRWWAPYVEVNERFAEAAAAELAEGGTAWVHDYHLQLVPGMIRRLRPDVKIGFFLHIPFPPIELFARLPWRREIVAGLLGADVVGFQTRLSAQNFERAARAFSDARVIGHRIESGGRTVRAEAYPISIDVGHFESIAAMPSVIGRARQLRESVGLSRKIVLGIDRLDYTKGIDVRLHAVEELLNRGHLTSRDIVFIQIAVPSRETVDEYAQMRSRIEELVGRINGEHAEPGSVVVQYLRRTLDQEELVAYYLAADVMVVSPLRDGMNLVAKEYTSTRLDNTGVLVLSEFAGAASELTRAMLVNPFDIDGVASTIEQALRLPPADMKRRMAAMRRAVKRNDVYHWASQFLGAVNR